MNAVLVTIFLISSLFQARWWSNLLPDLSLASIILLSMRNIKPWVFATALLGGVFIEGLDVNKIWVTPLLYLGILWFGQILSEHINMSLYFTKAIFVFLCIFIFWAIKYILVGQVFNITILNNLIITIVLILIIIPFLK